MKLFVLVICAFSVISSNLALEVLEKLKADLINTANECAKENGVTDDELNKIVKKISPPESHAGKCMLFCVAQRMGTFDNDGKYSETGTKAFFEEVKDADKDMYNLIMSISEKCGKEAGTGADPCETATNFFQCTLIEEKEMMG